MGETKQEKYLRISKEIVEYVGGMDNIQGTAHCATRLRISVNNPEKIEIEAIKNSDNVSRYFKKMVNIK